MEKYIKAQDACEAFANYIWSPLPKAVSYASLIVEKISAADVAPVRHGQWIPDKEDVEWGNSLIYYRCSECKERPHFDKDKYKFILSPYCPNCGAKMDKEITYG